MPNTTTNGATASTSPNQPTAKASYRLERHDIAARSMTIVADGLSYIEAYAICDRIPGLHVRRSAFSKMGGAQ